MYFCHRVIRLKNMRETGRPYLSMRFSYTCEISILKKDPLRTDIATYKNIPMQC